MRLPVRSPTGARSAAAVLAHRARGSWLQAAVVATPLLYLWCEARAGGQPHALLDVLVLAGACWSALDADSPAGSAVVAVLALSWLSVPSALSGWALPAAATLLAYHAAVALASTLPGRGRHDPRTLLLWGHRYAAVLGATAAVWALERALVSYDLSGNAVLVGAALALLAVGAWAARRAAQRSAQAEAPPTS